MEIKKILNPQLSQLRYKPIKEVYDISLIAEKNELQIVFGGNGDLYWMLRKTNLSDNSVEVDETYNSFYISKDNPIIYKLFDELYNDIINCNIFKVTEEEREMYDAKELKDKELEFLDLNEWYKYKKDLLVEEDKIKWHSDEQMFEYANVVTISKQDEGYLLEFAVPNKPKEEVLYRLPGTISIRFRNSGSTYDPFNFVFMRMYRELQKYNPEEEKRLIVEHLIIK